MYGLPQAGIIAQELLAERFAKHGYHQSKIIPGLWTHETRPTTFTLVVDDFTIKIMSDNNANHLINVLRKDYTITVDTEATKYIGLTIEWDYNNGKVHMHMPGYLEKAMTRFKQEIPTKVQNSPHQHIEVKYRSKKQFVNEEVESPPPIQRRRKICPGSIRHTPILWEGSQPHHSPGPQFNCHRASKTDGENEGDGEAIVRLLCDARGSHHNVHSQQNDPMHPQRRRLRQREE